MNKEIKPLNLGCGNNYLDGFINIDLTSKCDLKLDLNIYPYPFEEGSIDYILAEHILEHMDSPINFIKEMHRLLKVGGVLKIKVPHVSALGGAFGNMEHQSYFHEGAVSSIINRYDSGLLLEHPFKLIESSVAYGRFLFWQKREITWIVEKEDVI